MNPSKVIDEAKIVIAINSNATAHVFVDNEPVSLNKLFVYGTPQNLVVRMKRLLKYKNGKYVIDGKREKAMVDIDEFEFFAGGVEASTYKEEGETDGIQA